MKSAIAATLTVLLLVPVADAQARRAASRCSLGKPPGQVQMGKVVTLKGKVKPKSARTVKAQVLVNRKWTAVARGRSARRTGKFRLKARLEVAGPVKVRAYAPRTRRLGAAACRAAKISVQAP